MMDITYSFMTATDLPSVHDLWAQTEGVGLTESDAPEVLQAFLKRNPNLSLVARDSSRLVGAVLCGHDGRRGFLYHLAVISEYRGRGIGRGIVETCLASLAALGILKCNIFLYVDNEAGQRFWDRCGWSGRCDLKIMQCMTHRD